ncbi:MAG: hypothetical protein HQL52_04960 [Magnetococcales bacterium]|nr:hypothetical protein [Magnetococcales bacterium]
MAEIPTDGDWCDPQADEVMRLDQDYARKKMAGKSRGEVQCLFYENVLMCAEDLRWMPRVPFQYYVLGFRDYLLSEGINRDEMAEGADSFLNLVLDKLTHNPDFILPVMAELMTAVAYLCHNQAHFEADSGIYGDFLVRLNEISTRYETLSQP